MIDMALAVVGVSMLAMSFSTHMGRLSDLTVPHLEIFLGLSGLLPKPSLVAIQMGEDEPAGKKKGNDADNNPADCCNAQAAFTRNVRLVEDALDDSWKFHGCDGGW
jgi:hypothetical protein